MQKDVPEESIDEICRYDFKLTKRIEGAEKFTVLSGYVLSGETQGMCDFYHIEPEGITLVWLTYQNNWRPEIGSKSPWQTRITIIGNDEKLRQFEERFYRAIEKAKLESEQAQ